MISVLYVDDEPSLLELAREFLEQHADIRVDTVTSGAKALEAMKEKSFDVILSDYMMPEMDGISLLKNIRERYPVLPFIIFSGRGREEIIIEALNNGADYYLQKGGDPVSQFAELEHKLRLATEHRRANERIFTLNRLYSVLSRINLAIVRIREQDALFLEVCDIAVTHGGFRMAWVGLIDDTCSQISLVAYAGPEKQFSSRIPISDGPGTNEYFPGIRTVLGNASYICRDVLKMPESPALQDEAVRSGFNAFGAFPLRLHDRVIGALFVYAPDDTFFGSEEIQLLEEVASDISFALGDMEKESLRKQAETALRQSEMKYRIVANHTYDWELWWDPKDNYLYISPSVKRISGHDPEEFVSDPDLLSRIIHPDDLHLFAEHQNEVVHAREAGQVEFRIVRPDGTVRWIDHACQPVYDDAGKYFGHRACNRDITDRKELEENLFRISQIQTSLIRNAQIWLMILDENGDVKTWNAAAEQISGFSAAEAVGNRGLWHRLYPDKEYRKFVTVRIREIIGRNDYFENLETAIQTKSGETKHILWNTQKLAGSGEIPASYIAVGRDITALKMAQKTIESFALFMKNNPDPVMRIDRDGIVMDANEASAPLLSAWECNVGGMVPGTVHTAVRVVLDSLSPKSITEPAGGITYTLDLFPNLDRSVVHLHGMRVDPG